MKSLEGQEMMRPEKRLTRWQEPLVLVIRADQRWSKKRKKEIRMRFRFLWQKCTIARMILALVD